MLRNKARRLPNWLEASLKEGVMQGHGVVTRKEEIF